MPLPHSPAAERNRQSILEQLQRLLPPSGGLLLEVASGTGQHAAHCAPALPGWHWQPSDQDAAMLTVIAAHCAGLETVRAPLHLDVRDAVWPLDPAEPVDAMFAANMIHIAPWDCCLGLMAGAARHLRTGGLLILYGPYIVDGEPLADSNRAFDADLRRRDPAWGLRRLGDVQAVAAAHGLQLSERVTMPANNLMLCFDVCGGVSDPLTGNETSLPDFMRASPLLGRDDIEFGSDRGLPPGVSS